MTVPAIVEERLDGEDVTSRVPLGGDDELFVTPARTLVYRAEGLLSGESVEVYPHEAERLSVNEGRRKCTITLDHGLDGQSQFSVPADRFDQAIEPILHGVFAAAGITEPGETVTDVYRLGELTLVVTDARVVKHVGNALWDEEYEAFPFESVTGIDIEEGSVSSQIIVEVDGRPQRIKTPRDDARRIQREIQEGVLSYHDFASYDEFRREVMEEREAEAVAEAPAAESAGGAAESSPSQAAEEAPEADEGGDESEEEPSPAGMVFGEGVGTVPVEEADGEEDDVAAELAALRSAVERQNDLLRRQQQTVERLVRELRELQDGD
jgi:hypothetical protein